MNTTEAREKGKEFCDNTKGSSHYKKGKVEPLDLIIAKGMAEDFCLSSIIKYAGRFKETNKGSDLVKISDYAHILCGVLIDKAERNGGGIIHNNEEAVTNNVRYTNPEQL